MIIDSFQKHEELILPKKIMLDIIDFYLQYKPMIAEYVNNREHYLEFNP